MLARKQFHVRYKRALFGVLWAVAVPAVQAAALAVVFSRFVHQGRVHLSRPMSSWRCWPGDTSPPPSSTASLAIVEDHRSTDKLWFPRSILVLAECLANLPGLLISMASFLVLLPVLGVTYATAHAPS